MSGLETLPPDQRAVLQLILAQGRGYADLAALLSIDVDAVRSRAHAGLDALGGGVGPGHTLDAAQRARVADYLLGQQDDGEKLVTFAELGESAAACRWAQTLRERLAGVARDELPQVPAAAASSNGHALAPTPAAPIQPAAVAAAPAAAVPVPATPAEAAAPAPSAAAPTPLAAAPPTPPPARPDGPGLATPDDARSSSRLAGGALLAGLVAIVVAVTFVLIGDGDDKDRGTTTSAQTQTQPNARRQSSTTPAAQPRLVAQVNLNATPTGGAAVGIGLVQRSGRRQAIAIEAQRLPANGAQDIYAVWLQGAAGSRFLGFVPRQVRADGTFTVSAALPGNARDFSTVLITREGVTAVPDTPGEAILSGPLRLTR